MFRLIPNYLGIILAWRGEVVSKINNIKHLIEQVNATKTSESLVDAGA